MSLSLSPEQSVEAFIARWKNAGGSERANYQLFLTELCELLALPKPDPAAQDTEQNAYVFERRVDIAHADGTVTRGFIDLYRRGHFVLEAKQTNQDLAAQGWDKAMLRAHAQADTYARALPATEGRPPFIVVTDVGRSIELYSEFSRSGATYVPFPDPRSHRIKLEDLRNPEIRERLQLVWEKPLELDPARRSAKVTREIAAKLAELAKTLEGSGHHPEVVAQFLMRCLFTMFAEDVELLPKNGFKDLLEKVKNTPQHFIPLLHGLWETMNKGGFSPQLMTTVLRFNGGLFSDIRVLPLDKAQIALLIEAAKSDWQFVEPSIFGTLLERALDPDERHKLGAHYTPRAYVERLVLPTIIEPLREEWRDAQAAALTLEKQGKHAKAVDEIRDFQRRLCEVKVLDPACGTGNFLYVTLEHMKRLEGEILNTLQDLGETAMLEMGGNTVDPHQFLGLEINPRAAAIAEMVLWIGYLQWHFRTHGHVNPPEPVLKNFHNIENRDALLAYDKMEFVTDEKGRPICRWDGKTVKKHPVTGEDVPDDTATRPLERYVNPRKATWPQADFVVGNPPFIGGWLIRQAQGDGYVDTLWETYPHMPEKADYVMYWWDRAAELAETGKLKRFGFITTNSISQIFQRRVLQKHLDSGLQLILAIPNHPWVDTEDGAAVRIAMTVAGQRQEAAPRIARVVSEDKEERVSIDFQLTSRINADLSVGVDLDKAIRLKANSGLSSPGVQLYGSGFIVSVDEAKNLGLGRIPALSRHIRDYRNGKDLAQSPRGVLVIDLFGLASEEVKSRFPEVYQWILERVKPERDHNRREPIRLKWWRLGWERPELRRALTGLQRYISTVETTKHRAFVFLDKSILPDNMLINIACNEALVLGVLSSRIHLVWALAAGGTLEDRPRYNKTRCFEPFPFPDFRVPEDSRIRELAEMLDIHRKRQQEAFSDLTMTGMYNVLEKLRSGEPLTAKDKVIHEQGLVSVLKEIHDDLDRAVFSAYGWDDLADKLVGRPGATTPLPDKPAEQAAAEEELLGRLVALNAARAAEEANGLIRWLRPEFQAPHGTATQTQFAETADDDEAKPAVAAAGKEAWPKPLPEQVKIVRQQLSLAALTADALADRFKRKPVQNVQAVLDALEELGMVRKLETGQYQMAA